jgi:hypothetical protein
MTWEEFVDAVDSHLAVEANRRGLSAFRDRYMRNAVLDLQRYIRGYREGNTTVYTSAQVTDHGQAQLVDFPQGAKPKAVYIYSVDTDLDDPLCYRYRLNFYPWLKRQDLICGRLSFANWWGGCWPDGGCPTVPVDEEDEQAWLTKAYVYTIGPMGRTFLIYPKLTESTRLLLVWDGYKYTWNDSDTINFPPEASEAVASYVLAKIYKAVDKNIPLAREYEADYARLRLSLYRDFQETQDMEEKDEEYDSDVIPAPTNFTEFDAQSIPFLRTITSIAGSSVTALEAISTVSLETPTTVMLLIGGVIQLWMLDAGTTATGPGVMRPADYSSTTNAKVWVQLS